MGLFLENKPATHPSVVIDRYAESVRVDDEIDSTDVDGNTSLFYNDIWLWRKTKHKYCVYKYSSLSC